MDSFSEKKLPGCFFLTGQEKEDEDFLSSSTVILSIEEEPMPSQPKPKKQKVIHKRSPVWKKVDAQNLLSEDPPFQDGAQHPDPEDTLATPYVYFKNFVDDVFLDIIVDQSNVYAIQKNVNCPLKLSRDEFEQWLGLSIWYSLHKITDTRLHWSESMKNESLTSLMSRDRWEQIKTNVHLVDNTKLTGVDKIAKIRPFVDHLRKKFREIPMGRDLCIDESIIPFKGRSSLKQYKPKKPHKWGFQLFILADKDGTVYDFIPYTGKIHPLDDNEVPDLGASSNIVLDLAQSIPEHKGYRLYYDNWFTSVPLQIYLV